MTSLLNENLMMQEFFYLSEADRDIIRLWVSEFVSVYDCFGFKLVEDGKTWFYLYKRDAEGNRYLDETREQVAQYSHLKDTGYPSTEVLGAMKRALSIV